MYQKEKSQDSPSIDKEGSTKDINQKKVSGILKNIKKACIIALCITALVAAYAHYKGEGDGREYSEIPSVARISTEETEAEESMRSMSLHEAVGQMLMVGFRGYSINEETKKVLQSIQPGGVVLFDHDVVSEGAEDRNIASLEQVRTLTAEIRDAITIPPFIAIDMEGGHVNRLKDKYGFSFKAPSAQDLGSGSTEQTEHVAITIANELHNLGINWNFAPVVDVNVNPKSPAIGGIERSFSDNPQTVYEHAAAFIRGMRTGAIIPTLKHFPGHGSAAGDTHLGVVDVTDTYKKESEIAPYQHLIAGGYDDPIMTAHIVNRNLDEVGRPATLSKPIINLLRVEMGFDGIIISDDMQMGAIVEEYGLAEAVIKSLQAGIDIILIANQISYDLQSIYTARNTIINAVEAGTINEEQIYTSVNRILRLKEKYNM